MPSTSPKQHRFMEAIAHDPKFASKVGVSQKVGQDFAAADKASGKYDGAASDSVNSAQLPGSFESPASPAGNAGSDSGAGAPGPYYGGCAPGAYDGTPQSLCTCGKIGRK